MYLCHISGWPELGILVNWGDENGKTIAPRVIASECELVLATDNGQGYYDKNVLLSRGFELGSQTYRNPNSGSPRCRFYSGWLENLNLEGFIKSKQNQLLSNIHFQNLPYFCGIRVGDISDYKTRQDIMNRCCGNIHILDPITQEEDLNYLVKIGFDPVVGFKTGRVLLARFFPKYLSSQE